MLLVLWWWFLLLILKSNQQLALSVCFIWSDFSIIFIPNQKHKICNNSNYFIPFKWLHEVNIFYRFFFCIISCFFVWQNRINDLVSFQAMGAGGQKSPTDSHYFNIILFIFVISTVHRDIVPVSIIGLLETLVISHWKKIYNKTIKCYLLLSLQLLNWHQIPQNDHSFFTMQQLF